MGHVYVRTCIKIDHTLTQHNKRNDTQQTISLRNLGDDIDQRQNILRSGLISQRSVTLLPGSPGGVVTELLFVYTLIIIQRRRGREMEPCTLRMSSESSSTSPPQPLTARTPA